MTPMIKDQKQYEEACKARNKLIRAIIKLGRKPTNPEALKAYRANELNLRTQEKDLAAQIKEFLIRKAQ